MKVDSGWFIMVPVLSLVGSIVGLVLSIVPRLVKRLWRRPVGRAVQAVYVTTYVAIGVWVHHWLGVAYARNFAVYARELAADERTCQFCMAPIDGRYAWVLVWSVAGLVAYALRPGADSAFMHWWECRSLDDSEGQATEHWVDKMLAKPRAITSGGADRRAPRGRRGFQVAPAEPLRFGSTKRCDHQRESPVHGDAWTMVDLLRRQTVPQVLGPRSDPATRP